MEAKINKRIEVDGVLFSWLIPYVTDTSDKLKVGVDGMTAYERITAHKCKHFAVGFAEVVDFFLQTKKGEQHNVDSRVGIGIFLG